MMSEEVTMKIFIKAKPNYKTEKIERTGDNEFTICVKEPPIKGRANAAIILALAKHFKVPFSAIRIVSGYTSRQKIVEIKL